MVYSQIFFTPFSEQVVYCRDRPKSNVAVIGLSKRVHEREVKKIIAGGPYDPHTIRFVRPKGQGNVNFEYNNYRRVAKVCLSLI